jgi:diguanylate cyclase (GGDEF)-like protein
MAAHQTRLRDARSWPFDLSVCVLGLALLTWSLPGVVTDGWKVALALAIGVPLIVVVARFPMLLDGTEDGIEIGFDSSVLMFLLCTLDARAAVAVWGFGVLATQLTSTKRLSSQVFNIGVGISAGAVAAGVLHVVRGPGTGTPRELAAVALAAAAYFFTDYIVSAISVGIESGTPIRGQLVQPGTWIAVACFVPFDLLGYLGAVVLRGSPWWTVSLLVVPLATLLVATRAITRGRENARRLTVLLEAAVRAQTLHEPGEVLDALLADARRLTRLHNVDVRSSPPAEHEIGAQVRRGKEASWVVAPARDRARSTVAADQHALDALAAVSADAFGRLQLTTDMVHYARHDPLTDLPNRGILMDRVAHALHLARRRGVRVALLFIDLDAFKPVNDRFGHATGDAVLVEVARRLVACTRASDTVARLGGDEFAVLLEDVTIGEVIDISDRILALLAQGTDVAGHNVSLGASIGIAYGDGSESVEALLRQADLAMYEAKGRGKAQSVAYEPSIGRARLQRLELVEELRSAITHGDIDVVYQPVVATDTGRIAGVEALARWQLHGTDVPTEVFIRIAEDTGLVVPLGESVLSIVARDAAVIREAAGGPISVSVNASVRQLREPAFVSKVGHIVREMQRTGLVLEITERQGIGDEPGVLEAMRAISAMGVRFAIDDFGVGFSSISYLQDLPAHVIKVDATLSQHIDRDDRACAVLRAIAAMGEAMGLDVVIEGIERESQLALVRDDVHAPYAQGYLMHRPMPLASLLETIRADRARPRSATFDGEPQDGPDVELTPTG